MASIIERIDFDGPINLMLEIIRLTTPFAVLGCNLLEIDLVHLGARHRRAEFIRENEWAGTWLAP